MPSLIRQLEGRFARKHAGLGATTWTAPLVDPLGTVVVVKGRAIALVAKSRKTPHAWHPNYGN